MMTSFKRRATALLLCASLGGAAVVGVADAKSTPKPKPGAPCAKAGAKVKYKKHHLICKKNKHHKLVWTLTK